MVTFSHPEDDKILEYLNHWSWHNFLRCDERYTELVTRLFYSNLQFHDEPDEPFHYTSYICGQVIQLTLDNIANWLEVPNEGDETYILRGWPNEAIDTFDNYKTWFDRNNQAGAPLYATHLPSMHRLLFILINNILIPKAAIKTNIEGGPMYYLRHLIQLDDKRFNIPYIVMKHMKSAFTSNVARLPYAHMIHKIIRLNGIQIPEEHDFHSPIHVVDILPRLNWVSGFLDSGLPHFRPDGRSINNWIKAVGALPNQYWNPRERAPEPQPQEEPIPHEPPQAQQAQANPQFDPQSMNHKLDWIIDHMTSQHIQNQHNYQDLRKQILSVRAQVRRNTRSIKELDDAHEALTARFVSQFGASSSAGSQAFNQNEDDDEDEDDREEEDEYDDVEDD